MRPSRISSVSISSTLGERLEAIAEYAHESVESIVEIALARELRRKEFRRAKEEVSIEEIRASLQSEGDSVAPEFYDDDSVEDDVHDCELCGVRFKKKLGKVQGPIFCDDCLVMAKTAEFGRLNEDEI